jgi:hypothetical protein
MHAHAAAARREALYEAADINEEVDAEVMDAGVNRLFVATNKIRARAAEEGSE